MSCSAPVTTFPISMESRYLHRGQILSTVTLTLPHHYPRYIYITLVNNCSQMWAMYSLVMFYYSTREELEPWRPVGKFVCVKLVVFFTWWQSLVIAILFKLGLIHDIGSPEGDGFGERDAWSGSDVAKGLQNWLICVEVRGGPVVCGGVGLLKLLVAITGCS